MTRRAVTYAGLLCALVVSPSPTPSQTVVTIDAARTYQTIEGWGVCGVSGWRVKNGPFYQDAPFEDIADTLVNLIGITMVRGFDTRSCEFNPSAGEYVVTDGIRGELQRDSIMYQTALAAGELFRFAPNVFSPPPWMKPNGSCSGAGASTYPGEPDNSLAPEHYRDFGALCSAFIAVAQDTFTLPVYGFSPQNEPYFNEPYASCSYGGGAHYAEMLAVVGPWIRKASSATLIYGVEHMGWVYPGWENAVMANAEANPYLDRFAVHGAYDDVRVDTTTFDSLPDTHVRPLWLSEYNWGEKSYDESFTQAESAMKALVRSSMSAYMAGGGLWDNGDGTKFEAYYLNAQLFRFVRPGMVRLGAGSSDDSLLVGALRDRTVGSMSIILLNRASSERDVTLSITGASLPEVFQETRVTSRTEKFADRGETASDAVITLPPESIVSLGVNHRAADLSAGPRPVGQSSRAMSSGVRPTRWEYDLRGRRIVRTGSAQESQAPAAGVRVRPAPRGHAYVLFTDLEQL